MKAVDNYDYNGKYDHDVRRIWKRKIGIADQMDMLHICIYACMETNFVDLVKPVGEEDDHK